MILKRGMSEIVAVGRVVIRSGRHGGDGDKEWLKDYDGWNLSAYCFVDWRVPPQPLTVTGLTRGTIMRVNQPGLMQAADRIHESSPQQATLAAEPAPTEPVADNDILNFLILEGLRPSAAEELTSAFRRIRLLAQYYYSNCDWRDVREHETRTFLILPLLIALGWAEQQIKIELATGDGGRIDVACFSKPYGRNESRTANHKDCVLILEGKGFSSGLSYAPAQAHAYARSFPSCRAVVVSNGYCYKTYVRDQTGAFSIDPSAYLNLLDPRSNYPLNPSIAGCLEVLRLLLPHNYRWEDCRAAQPAHGPAVDMAEDPLSEPTHVRDSADSDDLRQATNLFGNWFPIFESMRSRLSELGELTEVYVPWGVYFKIEGKDIAQLCPQRTRVKVLLEIDYSTLDDPLHIACDATAKHKKADWARGLTYVTLTSEDQVEDVMDLIRQEVRAKAASSGS
jgi:predicted transport protein